MNYVSRETPHFLDKFFRKFDSCFHRIEQRENFRLDGTGLLLEIHRKKMNQIVGHTCGADYQSIQNFWTDSPWHQDQLNNLRMSLLQNNRQTKSQNSGFYILDDTANPKSGQKTLATAKQYLGCEGKVDLGQVVVTGHYADCSKAWPVNLPCYLPRKWTEQENERRIEQNQLLAADEKLSLLSFKPKWKLALELLDDALSRHRQYSHVLVDAWYGNCPDFIRLLETQKLYLTSRYANRRVFYQIDGDTFQTEHSLKDVVNAKNEERFKKVQYTSSTGEKKTASVCEVKLRLKNLSGDKRVLIKKDSPTETEWDKIEALLTNDEASESAFWLSAWSFRDKIDKFYQMSKDHLGFDQYQACSETAIVRHWYLVFLMYSFLIYSRQKGCFVAWCSRKIQSIAAMLQVIRVKLFDSFLQWLQKHTEQWHQFLRKQTGIRLPNCS